MSNTDARRPDDDGGTMMRGKRAKVASACVIAYGKFQPSGISGREVTRGHEMSEMPDG
jgi:hypothetical protein